MRRRFKQSCVDSIKTYMDATNIPPPAAPRFELHVTVAPQDVLTFARFCTYWKAKPLYIQLSHGRYPDQLMLAQTNLLSTDEEARAWAEEYSQLVARHFPVLRIKLESRLTEGTNEYYEAHWKLNFKRDPEYWSCILHTYLLDNPQFLHSRSLLDTRIHYLTERIYHTADHLAAHTMFDASGEGLNLAGLPLVKTHYERALWDSNPDLDAGWAR